MKRKSKKGRLEDELDSKILKNVVKKVSRFYDWEQVKKEILQRKNKKKK